MPEKLFEPMVFVDLETTGATGTVDRITEIGIVEVNEEGEVREWSSLVNPQTTIPPFIQNLTGITGLSLGGTTILIVVGVALETVRALESQMMMRHHRGFLE